MREIRRPNAGDSCHGGISALYNCLSWYKFVNTHLYHSRQLYNIQLTCTKFGKLILGINIKIVDTGCPISKLKCTKFCFNTGGAYSTPQTP